MTMPAQETTLAGRTIIVTRSAQRAGGLTTLFREAGAQVLEIPVTKTVDADDHGDALRQACIDIAQYTWVVVTSPEGAHRFRGALSELVEDRINFKIAAVGSATAAAVGGADLVPDVQTGKSLGAVFPNGVGKVLLAVAESAGTEFETAARQKGWTVDRVVSYRTVAVDPVVENKSFVSESMIVDADAVTFTSASSVKAWYDLYGTVTPRLVVAMGPMTAAALEECGITESLTEVVVASEQSLRGLVMATTRALVGR